MYKLLVLLLLIVAGCGLPDGNYPVVPNAARRISSHKERFVIGNRLITRTLPTTFEVDVLHDGKARTVVISRQEYDDIVRWGRTSIDVVRGRGRLQNGIDSYTAGEYSPLSLFERGMQ